MGSNKWFKNKWKENIRTRLDTRYVHVHTISSIFRTNCCVHVNTMSFNFLSKRLTRHNTDNELKAKTFFFFLLSRKTSFSVERAVHSIIFFIYHCDNIQNWTRIWSITIETFCTLYELREHDLSYKFQIVPTDFEVYAMEYMKTEY